MSTIYLPTLVFVTQEIVIYVGLFLFAAGVIGTPLVLLVFLSLRTFRQSSCAFYLIGMTLVNFIHLFTGLFTFVLINGFQINWTASSLFYCKLRGFLVQLCVLTSFTCMCLAMIDQFLATCSNPQWHRWNSIKVARYAVAITVIVWVLHGIPYAIATNIIISATKEYTCSFSVPLYTNYYNFFYIPVLTSSLPVTILLIFGILAYRNVQQIAYRTVPLVRRELDKQLTTMVLVQASCGVMLIGPTVIYNIWFLIITIPGDVYIEALISTVRSVTIIVFYVYFVSPFYIYMCVSKRFRQQFIHVLSTIHYNR